MKSMSHAAQSHPTHRRIIGRWLPVVSIAAIAAASLAACGSEEQSTSSATSPQAQSPSTSVPAVAGPNPQSPHTPTSTDASTSRSVTSGATTCGTVAGPDGALRVLVLAGNVGCATAKKIGIEYSPKISTGTQQRVSGWTCGPSEVSGILAACQSGDKVIGFTP